MLICLVIVDRLDDSKMLFVSVLFTFEIFTLFILTIKLSLTKHPDPSVTLFWTGFSSFPDPNQPVQGMVMSSRPRGVQGMAVSGMVVAGRHCVQMEYAAVAATVVVAVASTVVDPVAATVVLSLKPI